MSSLAGYTVGGGETLKWLKMTQQTLLLVIQHQEQRLAGDAVCYNVAFWRHLVDTFAYSHKPWNTCFCLRGRSAHAFSVCLSWRNSAGSPGTCTYRAKLKWGRGREEQQLKCELWLTWIASPLCAETCGGSGEISVRNDDHSQEFCTGTGAVDIW